MNVFVAVVAAVAVYEFGFALLDARRAAYHGHHRARDIVAAFRVRVQPPAPLRVLTMPSVDSDDALLDAIAAETGPRFLAALLDTTTAQADTKRAA